MSMEAAGIIRQFALQPHPEGGHYAETWRDAPADGSRGSGTAIHYLLQPGEHRCASAASRPPMIALGQRPQAIVPAHARQTAERLGAWTLVSCTVCPAFSCEGFELAPPGWRPMPRRQGRLPAPPEPA